jgi:hypothetical protein
VTSTIAIETSIAKSDDIWYCLPQKCDEFDETNDTKLNNKHNVQFIRKGVLPAPDYLDRFLAVDHWLPLFRQHPGFDLSSSQDDAAKIDQVAWGADGWTFKPMVVRILDPVSRNARVPLPIRHIINITVDVHSTNVRARIHIAQPVMPAFPC